MKSQRSGKGWPRWHYVEGQTVAVMYRWADGHLDQLSGLAKELVNSRVDVLTAFAYSAATAAKAETTTIPIVFYSALDPIEGHLVDSLAHPGGNLTGIVGLAAHLVPKMLSLLRDLMPAGAAFGLLVNPNGLVAEPQRQEAVAAAVAAGLKLTVMPARSEIELDQAFTAFKSQGIGGVIVSADAFFRDHVDLIVSFAARESIPTVYK